MKLIDGSHHDAQADRRTSATLVRLWIETSATYPGTYAALGCGYYPGVCHLTRMQPALRRVSRARTP